MNYTCFLFCNFIQQLLSCINLCFHDDNLEPGDWATCRQCVLVTFSIDLRERERERFVVLMRYIS